MSYPPAVKSPDPDLFTALNDYSAVDNDMVNNWDYLGLLFGFGKPPKWQRCPDGEEWTFKNIALIPKADGCSNPFKGWILGTAGQVIAKIFPGIPDYSGDPDAPWDGVSFSGACNFHDYCYSDCSKSQKECDKGLRDRAKQACADAADARSFPSPSDKTKWLKKCNAWASAYYQAVRKAGGNAYKNRQTKACECTKCFILDHAITPPPMACKDENANFYPPDQCPPCNGN
jgi:hypothetical protein